MPARADRRALTQRTPRTLDRMARVRLPLLLSGLLALPTTALGLKLVVDSYRVYDFDDAEEGADVLPWGLGFPLAAGGLALLIVL